MSYTPFKMKGPSLYRTPVKDNEQAKARENVKAMDKELDKLKPKVLEVRKQSLPSTKSRFFKDGEDNNIEAIIENTPKKRYTEEQKEYLKQKQKNKAVKWVNDKFEKMKNQSKKTKNSGDRYNSVITKYDKDGQVDDRDKWKRTPDWLK